MFSLELCIRGNLQWNLHIVVTLGPVFSGCIIEGGCIIEVHNTLAICTSGPNKVALLERWLLYSDHIIEVPLYYIYNVGLQ